MKNSSKLIWSLIAALSLIVVITGILLVRSYNMNKSNQQAMADLEANLNSVSDALEQSKTLADEKAKELENQTEAYQLQIGNMQQALDQTASERDTLQTQVAALTEKTEQAEKEKQGWQSQYEAADAELTEQKKQVEELNAQFAKLQSDYEAASIQSTAEYKSVSDALTKAQADLQALRQENETLNQSVTALKEQAAAAQADAAKKEQTLSAQIKALQEELEAAKTIAIKDAEASAAQVTALSEQLKKAQEDLAATNQKVENLTQTIIDLNGQLTVAKTAADKDAKQSVAQIASLNEKLTNAQTQLEAAQKEKEEQDQAVAALNEQLAAAQAAMISDAQQSMAKAATLNEQLNEARAQLDSISKEKEALGQSVAALNEQLAQNQSALNAALQEKEELEKTVASMKFQLDNSKVSAEDQEKKLAVQAADLNETRGQLAQARTALAAADQEREKLGKIVSSLVFQLNNSKVSAEEQGKKYAAQTTDLNETREQLAQAQAALSVIGQEKEELTAAVASLTEQLADAEKKTEELNAQIAVLNKELTQAKNTTDETTEALNAQLNESRNELALASEQLAAAASAQEKANEEANSRIAALEQKNKALTEEAAALRSSLEEETQKSVRLQEELDVQSAKPEALEKRLEAVSSAEEPVQEKELTDLANPILRAFRESIPEDLGGGTTYPVPASVVIDGQEVMTIVYDLTKVQEAQAYETAKQINDSQALYTLDLNHNQTAALIVNGAAFDKAAFKAVYAEIFALNPAASEAELNQLTAEEMTRRQVLREHAVALDIDPDALDMEEKLWEEALKHVEVSETDFSAALQKRQAEEDALLTADPAQYARMLEDGQIASPILPDGCRFVKQLIVPMDMSELDTILPKLEQFQKELDKINEEIDSRKATGKALENLEEERKVLAKQVTQLNSERKLLQTFEQRAKDKAADLALQIRNRQITFEDAAALARQDESMPASGYAVFSGAAVSEEEWIAAALALNQQGDVGEPIRMDDGYHVLYYSEEITESSAVIQAAQEELRQELLTALRDDTRESLLTQWIGNADVVLNVK